MPRLSDIFYSDLRNFNTLSPTRQSEVLDLIKKSTQDYYYEYAVEAIIEHLNKNDALDLFDNYAKRANIKNSVRLHRLCLYVMKLDSVRIRSLIVNPSSSNDLQKMILWLSSFTIEEEEQGLRALSKSKQVPSFIYDAKYKPRIEALKKLPSIMRLNCLESLVNQKYNSYNIFGNITDEEEFKSLVFSSTLKHRDRVEALWNKYRDLKGVGSPGSILASGSCSGCGEFEIIINSMVVKTQECLKKSRIGCYSLGSHCPFCGNRIEQNISIKEQEWKR